MDTQDYNSTCLKLIEQAIKETRNNLNAIGTAMCYLVHTIKGQGQYQVERKYESRYKKIKHKHHSR